jgi:hypothetical protein
MNDVKTVPAPKKRQPLWLIYIALVVSGILFLADPLNLYVLQRWPARLGIALIYSAVALMIGNGRPAGFVATAIVWISVLLLIIL